MKLPQHTAGLALGSLSGLFHFLWVIALSSGLGRSLAQWSHSVHGLQDVHTVVRVGFGTAIIGVIAACITGYIVGWMFAWLWNRFENRR